MATIKTRLKQSALFGVKKGWSGCVWMLKILIPISFLTVLIEYSGLLAALDFILEPAMEILRLPPVAALPLIIGILTGIYGAVASMAMLPLTLDHMTLIAVFLLISHAMVQEGIIQGKSGMHPLKATLIRLTASFITVFVISRILDVASAPAAAVTGTVSSSASFYAVMKVWLWESAALALQIYLIITALMILLEIMKAFDIIPVIVRFLEPVLKLLGLDRNVGILWLAAAVFGISYGAAVIVEEAKNKNLTKEDLERLHVSIGINHAMIEDPALFLPLGISPFFLWIPRLVTAITATHLFNLAGKIMAARKPVVRESARADS